VAEDCDGLHVSEVTMFAGARECTAVLLALLLLALAVPGAAQQVELNVVGLSEGRAVIVDAKGRPKVYRDGDTLPNGARLVRASPESAVVELNGKRSTLRMGTQVSTATPTSSGGRVVLTADGRGHFETIGTINGATVRFLVDTGASMVSMGIDDARRIGINYLKGETGLTNTANGVARVYRVKLDAVKIGDITVNGVDGLVHENSMPFVLLGMTFLNRLEMYRAGDTLTLVKRF
jgi:aspartyl protease family protein